MTQKAAEKLVKAYTAKRHQQWYWSEKQKTSLNRQLSEKECSSSSPKKQLQKEQKNL